LQSAMIDYSDRGVLGIIFSWTGSTTQRTWVDLAICVFITFIANVIVKFIGGEDYGDIKFFRMEWWKMDGHSLTLMPLAFLVVFRTNMAYGRYMEGRGHVGLMVHSARELARGAATYVKGDDPETKHRRANLARLVKAYTIALRLSLRKIEASDKDELKNALNTAEFAKITSVKKNFVVVIVKWLGDAVAVFKGQLLFDRAMDFMEKSVTTLMEAWMGMHKLATTPMPFPYVNMLYSLLYLWMYTVGFPLAVAQGWISMVIVLFLGFALFGINAIGQELEDPFGTEANDLDLEFF